MIREDRPGSVFHGQDGVQRIYLGGYLRRYSGDLAGALACRLAAALIFVLAGAAGSREALSATASLFRDFGTAAPPQDVPGLCRQIGDIPGTDLPDLIARQSSDPATAEATLRFFIAQAQELATAPPRN